ncbi:endonuclease domain-containing protein [Geodermatophilus sp. SYSU D01062]
MDDVELPLVYTWTEARAAGARRRQVAADGRRLTRGLYLSAAAETGLAARCRAWTRLLPPDTAFGLSTAAVLLGAHTDPPPEVEVVLRPRPVLPQRRGLAVHVRDLRSEDVTEVGGLRVTSGAQTFLDLAPRLPPAELVAVGDTLLRAGRLDAAALERRLGRAGRTRGVVRARECAPLLSRHAMSRPESLLRYWLTTSDLPAPEVQLPVLDRRGRVVAHADLGYAEHRLAIEYEGRQHAEAEQFGRDVDRYSLMAAGGWLVLRFAARHLSGPAVVVERTRRALLSRGWRPGR